MLAMDFAQWQPIAIAILVALCVARFLKLKQVHQPRELLRDESSKVDVDFDCDVARTQAVVPTISGEEIAAANSALETKMAVLQQLLTAADQEADSLIGLLEEARCLRAAVARPSEHTNNSMNADDDGEPDLKLSTVVSDELLKVNKRQYVRLLHASGFSAKEVAGMTQLPIEIVLAMLGSSGEQDRAAS